MNEAYVTFETAKLLKEKGFDWFTYTYYTDVYAECRRMDAINTASVCENMTKIQNELQKKGGQNEND